MRVERFLEDSARIYPERVAVVADDRRLTYADLDAQATRLAFGLAANGVRRGDRVVLFLDNSAEAIIGIFAVLKAGGVFCVINPTTKADKLAYVLNNCDARAVISQAKLLSVARAAIDRADSVRLAVVCSGHDVATSMSGCRYVGLEELIASAPSTPLPAPGIDIDLAMLVYTSGSTGHPKGVMMTHQNVEAAADSITTYLELTSADTILSVLPLSFDYGLYQALMACYVGATLILEKSFSFPYVILQKLRAERVTGFPLVPTMAALLLQMKNLEPGSLPELRYITNTAAALPPAHIARLQELFPATRIYSMYGLTECKRCTYLPPEQLKHRPGSVGMAIPNTEAYIVDERGERVGPDTIGELVIRGAHVMKGYWQNDEETARKLRPGPYPWEKVLYTGDLFRMDFEGYLYFVGRKDDIIKSRGEKVSPKEVENVLYGLDGVREAAVVGVPDPVLGEAIKAVIVPAHEGCLAAADVLAHCAQHLEDFMVPRHVEFRSDLPKTDSGKIRRSEVQAEVYRNAGIERRALGACDA